MLHAPSTSPTPEPTPRVRHGAPVTRIVMGLFASACLMVAVATATFTPVAGAQTVPAPVATTAPPTTVKPAPAKPAPAPPPAPAPDPAAKLFNHLWVDLAAQRVVFVANDGSTLWVMPMSSGRNGATPRGTFHIYSKSASTVATSDRRVSMRHMTRFNGGIGFHGIPRKNGQPLYTPLGQRPVSHGCIRLSDVDAEWIYHNLPIGTRVVVK